MLRATYGDASIAPTSTRRAIGVATLAIVRAPAANPQNDGSRSPALKLSLPCSSPEPGKRTAAPTAGTSQAAQLVAQSVRNYRTDARPLAAGSGSHYTSTTPPPVVKVGPSARASRRAPDGLP